MRIHGIQKPCRAVTNSNEDMYALTKDKENKNDDALVTVVLVSNCPPDPRRRWTSPISGYELVIPMKHTGTE